jgi:hypothetical protein
LRGVKRRRRGERDLTHPLLEVVGDEETSIRLLAREVAPLLGLAP